MFKAIAYSKFNNKIDLWEVDNNNNRSVHHEFYPDIEYYVEDKSKKSKLTDIYGNPVIKKIAKHHDEITSSRNAGIKMCESDLPMETKFLQKYYANTEFKINMSNLQICTLDLEISAPDLPDPVDPKYPINLVTLKFSQTNKSVTIGLNEYTGDKIKDYHWVHSEKMLIEKMVDIVRKNNTNIITGWNVLRFDCAYILKRSEALGIEKNFSPLNKYYIKTVNENKKIYLEPKFQGLAILDYQTLYKKFTFENKSSYSLQSICMEEISEGKLDYEGVINDLDKRDWNLFCEYNVNDVELVIKLENKLKFLELAIILAHESLIPFEDVFSQMRVLLGYIIKFLHLENMILPDRIYQEAEKLPGGYVFAELGKFKNIITFDVQSMYPHAIMGFNMSPETLVLNPSEEEKKNLISTPLSEYKTWELETGEKIYCGGVYFRRDKIGVVNKITAKIFNERLEFKRKQEEAIKNNEKDLEIFYDKHQLIRKILINSLYGVLGNEFFHLYNINIARCITLSCQTLIKYLAENTNDYLKNYFYTDKNYFKEKNIENKLKKDVVCRADTDSLFISVDEFTNKIGIKFENDDEFIKWSNEFVNNVMNPFYDAILQIYANKYGIKQIIKFKREKILTDILILAKKSYSYRMVMKDNKRIDGKIQHMGELVKKTIPQFCRNRLTEIVKSIFKISDKEEVLKIIRETNKRFRETDLNEISVIKGTSNYSEYAHEMSTYLKNGLIYPFKCPSHVRAAMNYNYMIAKFDLKLIPISNGSKIRYIQIKTKNLLNQDIISWIGNYPEDFKKYFEIDYDTQFEKTFLNVAQSIFEVLKWGQINLKVSKMNKFII